ncbi:hypothetical protein PHET_06109 [Paragonimus heterotremus]|uniref:Nodal modulator 1 n=1 Tax=Paragonimus heterotremus TaxID=100268 RepID=A0A8J4SNS5_9TREM|nr:hypothetical protein PHET_06109 [Paragonimus heterotremus]
MFHAVCAFGWVCSVVISLISLHLPPCFCASQPEVTVRGCGGFIRWKHHDQASTKVAFNKIKVQLVSLPGNTLKDVTEVLPNGAFSVPVYDTGPYRLILVKPKGWYFGPVDEYVIDIRTDPTVCDRDLNFDLHGFSIYGRVVTFGLTTGPSDLTVRLMDTVTGQTVQLASTLAGGTFEFGSVLPGQYELAVSDGKQVGAEHVRARTTINLGPDSLTLDEPIVLKGHFVRGRIVDFENNPLDNVTIFLLMNTSLDEQSKVDCNSVPNISTIVSEIPLNFDFNHNVVCLTRSNEKGQFSFDRLPGGSYALFPHYSKQVDNRSKAFIDFAFDPPFLHVLVEHTDVDLGIATFRAIRFRLPPGRVTWPSGNFVSGVKVSAYVICS